MSLKLIIDTDAGIDDALALMLAMTAPGVEVAALTCVTGNVDVDLVVPNVALVAQVMGCSAPIYRGCERPFLSNWAAEDPAVHGGDGMGDWAGRPAVTRAIEDEHAVSALLRLANAAPGEYTLVTLGPLTNIALALARDPDFLTKFKSIAIMGGAYAACGNTENMTAEWNLYCDPEAGKMVFDRLPASTVITWETTLFNRLPWPVYHQVAGGSTEAARFFKAITENNLRFSDMIGGGEGYLIPDPLAMACALDPGLIRDSSTLAVTVETAGRHSRGQTVVDYLGRLRRPPNARLVSQVDMDGVSALFLAAVR